MNRFLPSTNFYTLSDLDINIRTQAINFSSHLLDKLSSRTLTSIRNAFSRALLVWQNGICYIKVSELSHLLRTGNSGAHNVIWQDGIDGYVSPSRGYDIDGNIYITGSDFCGILDARIASTYGLRNIYLRYIRSLYQEITSLTAFNDLRVSFVENIEQKRNNLKQQRISTYGINRCEFTGENFNNTNEVQFAHIESVSTSPLNALNINNGVIIFTYIHADLTRRGIHDFAGMYDYCLEQNYNTSWADNFEI